MKYALIIVALAAAWIAWRTAAPPPPSPRPSVALVGPHEGRVTAILSGDPPVTGDAHGRVVIWSTPPDSWIAHDGAVRRVLRVDDGLITVGGDGSVARWQRGGRVVWRRRHPEALNDGVWIDDTLVVATVRGTIARLDADGPAWQSRGAHGQTAFAVLADGDAVLSTGTDGRIARRRVSDGHLLFERAASLHWIGVLGRVGASVVFGDATGHLGRSRGESFMRDAGIDGPVVALAAGPLIAIGGESGQIAAFNRQGGRHWIVDAGSPVLSLGWRGTDLLVGGGADGAVRVFRMKDGLEIGRLPPQRNRPGVP